MTVTITHKQSRWLGLAGVLGGLTLFAGDMLLYWAADSTDLKLNMAHAAAWRILASGLTALLAAWLYLAGTGQVYYAFMPATRWVRLTVTTCFAAILVAYGVVHGNYIAIAATAQLAVQHGLDMAAATNLAVRSNEMLRWVVYPVFGLLSVLFVWQVWQRHTRYPRWMLLFFPLLPFLLQGVVSKLLSGQWWVVVMGGYLNLLLVIFFAASTIALWRK